MFTLADRRNHKAMLKALAREKAFTQKAATDSAFALKYEKKQAKLYRKHMRSEKRWQVVDTCLENDAVLKLFMLGMFALFAAFPYLFFLFFTRIFAPLLNSILNFFS